MNGYAIGLTGDTTIADGLQLIRAEHSEVPGLRLTKPQVQDLWSLEPWVSGPHRTTWPIRRPHWDKRRGRMTHVPMTQKNSIGDQLEQMHQRIAQRAYELFRGRGTLWGDTFGDWFTAEREILWKPPIELREKDGTVTVVAALAGVDPKDVAVDITPQDMVIRAAIGHTHANEEGQVHLCEFVAGHVFRSVHFPKPVDMMKAKADYKNGLLTVTAPIATEAQARRLDVEAA
jgi:HSP20 family protein